MPCSASHDQGRRPRKQAQVLSRAIPATAARDGRAPQASLIFTRVCWQCKTWIIFSVIRQAPCENSFQSIKTGQLCRSQAIVPECPRICLTYGPGFWQDSARVAGPIAQPVSCEGRCDADRQKGCNPSTLCVLYRLMAVELCLFDIEWPLSSRLEWRSEQRL